MKQEMNPAEISLAFAREVAGYPDAFWAGDYLDNGSAQRLPDYSKDWNAVIAEIEKRGWDWVRSTDTLSSPWHFRCISKYSHGRCSGDDCAALARAVLDCVRAMRSQDA